jgi:predicted transposase YbfD/YdcC
MAPATPVSGRHHLAGLSDPRTGRCRRQELPDVSGIAPRAVTSGADPRTAAGASGRAERDRPARRFGSPDGIPSPDASRRVFRPLDPEQFRRGVAGGVAAWAACGAGSRRTTPIDGETARRGGRRRGGPAPSHPVSARAGASHVTPGRVAVADKPAAITAIPRRRESLGLPGASVTIDAPGCQKGVAAKVIAGGGDYLRSVAGSQPHRRPDIRDGEVGSHSHIGSIAGAAGGYLRAVRGRWGVEDSLPWCRTWCSERMRAATAPATAARTWRCCGGRPSAC